MIIEGDFELYTANNAQKALKIEVYEMKVNLSAEPKPLMKEC